MPKQPPKIKYLPVLSLEQRQALAQIDGPRGTNAYKNSMSRLRRAASNPAAITPKIQETISKSLRSRAKNTASARQIAKEITKPKSAQKKGINVRREPVHTKAVFINNDNNVQTCSDQDIESKIFGRYIDKDGAIEIAIDLFLGQSDNSMFDTLTTMVTVHYEPAGSTYERKQRGKGKNQWHAIIETVEDGGMWVVTVFGCYAAMESKNDTEDDAEEYDTDFQEEKSEGAEIARENFMLDNVFAEIVTEYAKMRSPYANMLNLAKTLYTENRFWRIRLYK